MRRPALASTRRLAGALAAMGVMLLVSLSSRSPATMAHASRRLNATATAHLHLLRADGSRLIEEGPVFGRGLKGSMRAELETGALFTGSFTARTHGGSIRGRGRATPRGSGRYLSFRGTLVVTGGSGRYRHAHGRAGLYGVYDRESYAITVQTTGSLSY